MLKRDLARKPVDPSRQCGEAHPRLGQGEYRALGGHDDVAGQRDFEAPAHRNPVHRCDERLHARRARGEASKSCLREFELSARGLHFEIVPGTEGLVPSAGHDDDPKLRVRLELVEDTSELTVRRGGRSALPGGSASR